MDVAAGDGWGICGFLGLPVTDMPFPHKHRGEKRMREGTATPISP